jgi:tRNA threonylcarbamoyladenosine biosynthesis protein TsaE
MSEKILIGEEETRKFAKNFANQIIAKNPWEKAVVIGLVGELGSGKTTFSQYFLKEFGVSGEVFSPTFVLMKSYDIAGSGYSKAIHIDCYRMENKKELMKLGFEELIKDPQNILLVEWADKVKELMPKKTIWIELIHIKENARKVVIREKE